MSEPMDILKSYCIESRCQCHEFYGQFHSIYFDLELYATIGGGFWLIEANHGMFFLCNNFFLLTYYFKGIKENVSHALPYG